MPLLYYWKPENYRRDLDWGVGYHLNQNSPLLCEIDVGDSLWAFTRNRQRLYVLAAELVVHAKTKNPSGYRYGRFRAWGDLQLSKYFQIEHQQDITALIRSMKLSTGRHHQSLGQAFQGRAAVRQIQPEESSLLKRYSESLPLEPRARLIPEERLEALAVYGDTKAIEKLIRQDPTGIAEERAIYLSRHLPQRSRTLSEHLKSLYVGQCQICLWDPLIRYNHHLSETHHLQWLSRGGADQLVNMVLLCPNHHRAVHQCDAPFDWEHNGFIFGKRLEKLQILKHEITLVSGVL